MYAKRFKVKCHGIYNLLSNGTAKKKRQEGDMRNADHY